MDEITEALKLVKNGKATRHDKISGKMLKYMGREGIILILDIFNDAWMYKRIPKDWEVAVIIPLHKKGDTTPVAQYVTNILYTYFIHIAYWLNMT